MDVTLLITTYNRSELLRRSLERLCHLTLPAELIVVDDGGTDGADGVCRDFERRLPIRYIHNDNPGATLCSLARNIGVRAATHDWIVTSEPELCYVTDVLAQFEQLQPAHPDVVISAGSVYFAPEGHIPGGDLPDDLVAAGDYTPPQGSQDAIGWVAPYTALWGKSWLEEVHGWDEGFPGAWGWDDVDLLTRLRMNGHGQHIALDVVALHQFHGYGGDANFVNEAYWLTKSFHNGGEDRGDRSDVIANKEGEWGQLRTPSS